MIEQYSEPQRSHFHGVPLSHQVSPSLVFSGHAASAAPDASSIEANTAAPIVVMNFNILFSARVVDQARPWRQYFPLKDNNDPD
jgi:hypothetical protein